MPNTSSTVIQKPCTSLIGVLVCPNGQIETTCIGDISVALADEIAERLVSLAWSLKAKAKQRALFAPL